MSRSPVSQSDSVSIDGAALRHALFSSGDCDLTVLVPAFNEAESLPELVDRVARECTSLDLRYEILVIDDGSTDESESVLRDLRHRVPAVRPVHFLRNYGKSAALAAGFERAKGDVVITMDADLQDDPAEIPFLLAALAGGLDLVSGWKQERKDPFIKTSTSKIFNRVTGHFTGLRLHDFNCGLKAYRKEVAKSLRVYGELHRYLPVLAHVMGFRVGEIPVRHYARQHGVTKFGSARFLNGMFDLMTVLFLTRQQTSPLHFFGRVGLVFGILGGGISLYFLGVWAVEHALRLRPLMLLGISFLLVAIQFISLGLLAELLVAARGHPQVYRVRAED
jgi:glycosyltransferase involved in cell wall biosynthesis